MAETSLSQKRKDRKSSTDSSVGDCHSPEDKKIKFEQVGEAEFDEIQSVLEMAEDLLPKLNAVLRKLDVMEKKRETINLDKGCRGKSNEKMKRLNSKK